MGVPKFFRWISERYPCLSQIVKEHQIPEFDNLYLDMNGIIHNCSHPDDANAHFRISEEKIFLDIFNYIEVLFRIIKPRKALFMAVDGIAPRAKMNQQRSRRFRSAMEAKRVVDEAKRKGEDLPTEEAFDSNCITPGTEFMDKLQQQLKYFISRKISTDEGWQSVDVYLSGHETPGEGEHKIMEFIRYLRSRPDYDPSTRHCLYGLDADLIILGLASHEPHFSLLREEVLFGKRNQSKRSSNAEDILFYLLHLSLLRDYLDCEYCDLQNKIKFTYDLERIIDDWILMGYLVGNDFIPHLPHLHIHKNALVTLERAYKELLPTFEGYIHDHGVLNMTRFEKLLEKLSEYDLEQFQDVFDNIKWLEMKRGGGIQEFSAMDESGNLLDEPLESSDEESQMEDDLKELIQESEVITAGDISSDTLEEEFKMYRMNYYKEKLEMNPVTEDKIQEVVLHYIKTIHWILKYYYCGVQSWSWFYPHHYAPFITDIVNFKDLDIKLEMSQPFLPFQQLMAVLPEASKKLLPLPYQSLMTSQNSPIIEFYPVNFATDLNEKQNSWEAVVKIPFIDETLLLQAMKTVEHQLSDSERKRNKHGPHILYRYNHNLDCVYKSAHPAFPDIFHCHASSEEIDLKKFHLKPENIVHGLYPGVKLGVYCPGFPTLQHLDFTTDIIPANVRVFQSPSKNENLILKIQSDCDTKMDIKNIAKDLIGKKCYVRWPHLVEALVIEITSDDMRYSKGKNWSKHSNSFNISTLQTSEKEQREKDIDGIKSLHMERHGIDIGITHILVKVLLLVGRTCTLINGDKNISLENQWSDTPQLFPYQTIVKDIRLHDSESFKKIRTLSEFFPVNCTCFLLKSVEQKSNLKINYGASGKVVNVDEVATRIRLRVTTTKEPDFSSIQNRQADLSLPYWSCHDVAHLLNVPAIVVTYLTATCFIFSKGKSSNSVEGKINIGLNLRQAKRNKELVGYTHKVDNQYWVYSDKTIDLLRSYIKRFPKIVSVISNHNSNKKLYQEQLEQKRISREMIEELRKWLKSLPDLSSRLVTCGSDVLETEVVAELENCVEEFMKSNQKVPIVQVYLKPNTIFKPYPGIGKVCPDVNADFQLFDRVINISQGIAVPCGYKGTVIGLCREEDNESDSIICDILFDLPFPGGRSLRCSGKNAYRMAAYNLLNISYGMRKGKHYELNSRPRKISDPRENKGLHKKNVANTKQNHVVNNHSGGASKNLDRNNEVKTRRQVWQNMKENNLQKKVTSTEKSSTTTSVTASKSEITGPFKDSKQAEVTPNAVQNKETTNTAVHGTKLIKNLLKIGTDNQKDETPMTVTNQQPSTKKRNMDKQTIARSKHNEHPIDAVRKVCEQSGRRPPRFTCYKIKEGIIGVVELDDGIQFSSPLPSLEYKEAYNSASIQALQYLENQLPSHNQREPINEILSTENDVANVNESSDDVKLSKPNGAPKDTSVKANYSSATPSTAVPTLTEQLKSIGVRNVSSVKPSGSSNNAKYNVVRMPPAPVMTEQSRYQAPMNFIHPSAFRFPVNFNAPVYPAYHQWIPRPEFNHYHRLSTPVNAAPHGNSRPQQSFVPLQVMKNNRSAASKHKKDSNRQP